MQPDHEASSKHPEKPGEGAHAMVLYFAARAANSGRKSARAAAAVASMSRGECAADMNPASNADGAKYTPSASIAWKNRLNRCTSLAMTLAKLSTADSP
jgi:hypothetical protein